MSERFPNVEWYCDKCRAHLNIQPSFSDRHYIWKCTKCGYKSSISRANIVYKTGPSFAKQFLGKTLGVLGSISLYVVLLLIANVFIFKAELPFALPVHTLMYACCAYAVITILFMIFEKLIVKYCRDMSIAWFLFTSPFVYFWGNLNRPIIEPIILICKLTGRLFSKRKRIYNLALLITLGTVYSIVLAAIVFSLIWLLKNSTSPINISTFTA